ncbi:MFS general substrate transporter [Alternaria alternata]|nr:MFS general substrate transporter [Alternaria alternata]
MIEGRKSDMPYSGHTIPSSISLTYRNMGWKTRHTPVYQNIQPNLPIQKGAFDKFPLKTVILCYPNAAICLFLEVLVLQAVNNKSAFFFREKGGGFREIEEGEVCNNCHDDSEDSF